MSQFNLRYVPTLSCNQFLLNGQNFSTQAAIIANTPTSALTTEVIINDDTKNQVLFQEIAGNIHGNLFPQVQAEIDALEANVVILQGNVVSLQSQINVLTGNVVFDEFEIAALFANTQFLEAPHNGLAGNTSFFWRGLQVYNTPTDAIDEINGTGIFSYLDGAGPSNQIQLRAQDSRFVSVKGSTFITTPANGQVNISGNSQPFLFSVGNSNLNNGEIAMNGNINLKGEGLNRISVYTKSQLLPVPSTTKTVDIVGADEANILGKKITAQSDNGGQLILDNGATLSGGSVFCSAASSASFSGATVFINGSNGVSVSADNGKEIFIDCTSGSSNSTIKIGTSQGATDTGYKEITIGQSNTLALRKSSTFLLGDTYMPYGGLVPPNTGGWDLLLYQGFPTPFSGPTNAPVKTTVNPYFRSIATFAPDYTNNSFIQASGTFSVLVGAGGIIQNCGIGGFSLSCLGGAVGITALVGGVLMTTAAGAIQMTTGAGAINMTTGAAPIQMETNIGDVLIKAGYAFDSTPELSLGSIYLQARDYTYLTPDKNVVVGAGIEPPFNEVIANTLSNSFFGNLFTTQGPIIGNVVFSNVFTTPNVKSSIVNPLIANLYYQGNIVGETGRAQASLFFANGTVYSLSDIATVPYYGVINANGNILGNIETTKFTFNFTDLPLNANMYYQIDPIDFDANITTDRYAYGTWQSNAQIQSNISILVNAFLEPPPPTFDRYLTVLGNASFQSDVECNSNIIVQKDAFPLLKTEITNNSIFTSGNITCQTLNYTTLNPPIVIPNISGGGVDSIIAGTNVSISPLNGQGNVVINCTLPNIAGVNQIIAGNGIEISPVGGQGNVVVQLAGSVIPPGGYLPINGGVMTGPIYQFPSSNINDNTVKKYRPLTSYQPPFPSIGPPTFTGEMLTFFNGDNSPEQSQFTGWFPQNMFQYEPDVITQAISGVVSNFYSSTGGTTLSATDIPTGISNFTVGQRITGGSMVVNGSQPGYRGVIFYIYTAPPDEGDRTKWVLLYQTTLKNFPTTASTYSLSDIDYIYDGSIAQLGQNWMVVFTDAEQTSNFISLNTVNTVIGSISTYAWDGNIANFVAPDEYFIGVQGDPTTSVLYEYFSTTNLTNKLLAVTKASGLAKIHGIYSDDTVATRQIIVYGDFENVVQGSNTIVVNNIFQYNINTNTVIQLTTQTSDPAYAGNLPKGVNGAVYGVEKQVSATSSRRVWIWGDMTGVAQMGNPAQPTDCTLKGGCNATTSDNWAVAIEWDFAYALGQGPFNCRGGRIINNVNPGGSPNNFLLLLYCGGRFDNPTFNSLSMIYYNVQIDPGFLTSPFPFQNGSITSPFSKPVDYIYLIDNQIIMTGEYTGTAQGASATDVPIYSIMRAPLGTFDNPSGQYSTSLFEMANSSNAGFWLEGTDQIGVSRIKLMNGGHTLVLGTDGYGTPTLGGGVLTFNFLDITIVNTPAVKFTIVGVPPYTVLNIANDVPTAVLLSCNLNEDNFFFGQTFDASFVPQPPSVPTVNAINGAVFAVGHFEMTKIVFSSGNEDYNSVSFIAGDVEAGDKSWYWQAQVGAIDYFAGNTFFPNITAIGTNPVPTSDTLGAVMINGSIASTNLNMNNFDIVNCNMITSANILTLNPFNGVEVGIGQRRELLVSFEKQNTGALSGQNNFDSVSGIQNVSSWTNPTNIIYVNTITASFGYDDGNNGNSTITIALIEDDNGTETVLGSQSRDTSSGLSTQPIEFDPPITINPSATKFFFVRLTVPAQSPMYSYYGTTSDGLTPAIIVSATQLEEVSDPVEYFNVYGNCFFQENVLVHSNITVGDPTNEFFKTVLDYNQIQLLGETFNTQMAPGQTFINSGVNQTRQEATYLQIKRNDITRQATLNNGSLAFVEGTNRTATYSPFTCDINSTSGPIARATMQVGALTLNNNSAGGSVITLNKDAISVATDEISSITSATKDANGTSRIFTKFQSRTSAVGTGNQDGTIAIFTLVNGVLLEVFNFHGGENENNSFRNLDMNGNSVRTTQGNIALTAVASTGVGNTTIQSKVGANINIDTGTTGRVNWNTATTTTTPNHNVQFNCTSSGVSSNNYLKMRLNGVDIWVPYLTVDPSL